MTKLAIFFCGNNSDCAALIELFGQHLQVKNIGELLDSSSMFKRKCLEGIMKCLDKKLISGIEKDWIVFTVSINQLMELKLSPEKLLRHCGIDKALIIWRHNKQIKKLNEDEYASHSTQIIPITDFQVDLWIKFFQCWPIEVSPIFVQYEELFNAPENDSALSKKLVEMVGMDTVHYYCGNLKNKIAKNCNTLCSSTLHTLPPTLYRQVLLLRIKLPYELADLLPEPEPRICMSTNSAQIIRVVEPYIPLRAIQNVNEALTSKQVSSAGIWPKQLAAKLISIYGFPVAVPCSSGFTSLVLALRSAYIGPGSDVLMPSLTFVAVSNAVLNLERASTSNTRAVIVTHTYGCPARDIELVAAGCKTHGWTLIEDISECVGITTLTSAGDERLLGTFGDYTCASLNANKIVHAGDGGFVLARDPSVGARLQSLANHGYTKNLQFVHFEAAINGKINGLGAALACGVLDNLHEIIAHRRLICTRYRTRMAQLFDKRLLVEMPRCGPRDTPWLFCLHCRSSAERTALRVHLATKGVETRNFFFPLHLEPMFDGAYVDFDMPTAQLLGSVGFSLPTHPGLDIDQIDQIAIEVCSFFNQTINHDDDQTIMLKQQKDNGVVGPTVQSRITELC
uniref:Uncharacterized protein n=1 Tax=Globodera rostochiensis TaxID=31243 RepID=A0A914IFY1_GLORO